MHQLPFKAVIFDLDGVISQTALLHSEAWRQMFNDYLRSRAERFQEPFHEFTHEKDYLSSVDGKPRYEGVKSFLESRGIELPWGNPSDSPDSETICGLGNMKNKTFNRILKEEGVQLYSSTLELIHELRKAGIKLGVASSSKNCKQVLQSTGIINLFETIVDGEVSAELGLKGKPEPDIFTVAADNLGAFYDQTVIVEDAVSGVQAAAKGNFGLVIGLAREGNKKELQLNGADIVLSDLAEISLNDLNEWFNKGLNEAQNCIRYYDYDQDKEKSRETLLTIGNGYFGSRGNMEESKASAHNYPGTYLAGLYNRLTSFVGNKAVENEDFVNCPNWTFVSFQINDGPWFDTNNAEILEIERKINFRTGLLEKRMTVRDNHGYESEIISSRFADMSNPHRAALRYQIKSLNYDGEIRVKTSLDGNIFNDGVARYRQLEQKHIKPIAAHTENNSGSLTVETVQSAIAVSMSSKIHVVLNENSINPQFVCEINEAEISHSFSYKILQGQTLQMEKMLSIYTSKDKGVIKAKEAAYRETKNMQNFDSVFNESKKAWQKIWDEMDIEITGDRKSQMLIRLHLYHLMVSASPYNKEIDASFTARGLHGEAYRGHIFWDELFILPFYCLHFPETAKASLLYRYRRLSQALEYARENHYEGAMYPWQSGSDGREETQIVHLNPLTGEWGNDHSSLQRHVSLAIAFNIYQYYHLTSDLNFMIRYGAEMFLEICRFWASKCKMNEEKGRYSIDKVMGPDEFHEKYPESKEGGLKDNSYTNIMVVWCFNKSFEILDRIPLESKKILFDKIELNEAEINKWKDISNKINLLISDEGIIAQYDSYFDLKELEWENYRNKYGNIYRLDRILKAEGKSADEYKVAKQADTLMTFYNLNEEEVSAILKQLGYTLPTDYLLRNLEYYLARTSHGSTLSRVVHAQLAAMAGDHALSWQLFSEALESDYVDIQGGTTGEGIHLGVMAGTIMIALNTYAGLDLRSNQVKIKPSLPKTWRKMEFLFHFKGKKFKALLTKDMNYTLTQELDNHNL